MQLSIVLGRTSISNVVKQINSNPSKLCPILWLRSSVFAEGSGFFAVNGISPLEAILLSNICDWSFQ